MSLNMWGMAPPKGRTAAVQHRIEQIVEWICEGMPRRMILTEARRKWGVSDDVIDGYSADARKIVRAMWDIKREDFVSEQMAALEHLAHLAVKSKQFSAAAGARATMARMVGVDSVKHGGHNKKQAD